MFAVRMKTILLETRLKRIRFLVGKETLNTSLTVESFGQQRTFNYMETLNASLQ